MGEFQTGQISLRSPKGENKTGQIQSCIRHFLDNLLINSSRLSFELGSSMRRIPARTYFVVLKSQVVLELLQFQLFCFHLKALINISNDFKVYNKPVNTLAFFNSSIISRASASISGFGAKTFHDVSLSGWLLIFTPVSLSILRKFSPPAPMTLCLTAKGTSTVSVRKLLNASSSNLELVMHQDKR